MSELEAHLRKDIQQQMRAGLDARQAFVNSVHRLGSTSSLKAEFAKTECSRKAGGRFMASVCILLVAGVIWLSGFTFWMLGMSPGEWGVAISAVGATLLVAGFWRYSVRYLPVIQKKAKRLAIECCLFASGFICSNLFCALILPYFERNMNGKILPATWLWAVFPIAVFLALARGIEQAVRGQSSANRPATS